MLKIIDAVAATVLWLFIAVIVGFMGAEMIRNAITGDISLWRGALGLSSLWFAMICVRMAVSEWIW